MAAKKTVTLRDLRDTIRFHQALGIDEYPKTKDVLQFLDQKEKAKPVPIKRAPVTRPVSPGNNTNDLKGFDNLEKDIKSCTLCRLSSDSLGRVPGKGKTGCRLMIVGDWSGQVGTFSQDILFGREEDVMLWNMMAAIKLQPSQVYATNILKCCPRDPESIDGKCEESCFSFLAREIAAVKPHIICAMGDMSVRVLMGNREPLVRLRGRFGKYLYQTGPSVLVMPTFHPRFLLQHPEMKKATWNDLQEIKRRLDEF